MTARYRRVSQNEPEEEETNKKLQAQRIERIMAKLHAIVWVAVAAALAYFTDLLNLLLSERVNRLALCLGVASLTSVLSLFLYLGFWLPIVMKNNIPWDVYCPNLISVSAGLSVLSFVSFVFTFWPVWGLLSPFFVGFLTMGFLFSTHFIPWPC
eukprot:gene63-69_t